MKPKNFDSLFTEKLHGDFLAEFVYALQKLKPTEMPAPPTTNATQNKVYDFLIKNIRPSIEGDGITGNQLKEIIGHCDLTKRFKIVPIGPEAPDADYIGGDWITGVAFMRASVRAGGSFLECLSLQNGWHKQLVSFYMRGRRSIDESNFDELFNTSIDQTVNLKFKLYVVELLKNGASREVTPHPEMYAYDYMANLAAYVRQNGRDAKDIYSCHEIFDHEFDKHPQIGMSSIFKLAHALRDQLLLRAALEPYGERMGSFLSKIAAKHNLPLPPDADPLPTFPKADTELPRPIATYGKAAPDGNRYH